MKSVRKGTDGMGVPRGVIAEPSQSRVTRYYHAVAFMEGLVLSPQSQGWTRQAQNRKNCAAYGGRNAHGNWKHTGVTTLIKMVQLKAWRSPMITSEPTTAGNTPVLSAFKVSW